MSMPSEFSGRPVKAVIDRSAFQHNIQTVKKIASASEMLVVIKADAYGHGLLEMAQLVDDATSLAVATAEEAQQLSISGISNIIWVLEGPFSEKCLALSAQHSIVWVIHSFWQLDLIKKQQAPGEFNVCLKLDTGMHRLGFSLDDMESVLAEVGKLSNLNLQACMTHFAGSDWPDSDSVTRQIHLFDEVLKNHSLKDIPQSLSNSGAILFYPEAHRDWVRPGIMLYGGMPNENLRAESFDLRPVMTFESAVMSLRHVSEGESVGYGAIWTAERDSVIAMVAGGYGDGYPRHAPNGTPLVVAGQVASLVGRVSMDMLAIDVTDLEKIRIGDPVEFWGKYISVDQIAALSSTISYELLTGVTSRVPRVYR